LRIAKLPIIEPSPVAEPAAPVLPLAAPFVKLLLPPRSELKNKTKKRRGNENDS
jgi:hypothetical protein